MSETPADSTLLPRLASLLRPFGLNLVGATTPAAYDALVPSAHRLGPVERGAVAVLVLGNGGAAFWDAHRRAVLADPTRPRPDPIDAFTATIMREQVAPFLAEAGIDATIRMPFETTTPLVSFVHLAEAAGLGHRSLLGVLVHPEWGPWMALRGAVFVDRPIVAPRPAAGFDPCPGCLDRPCIAACPAGAVRTPEGWDVPRCVDHRRAGAVDPCATGCHARLACVYGRHARYPADALAHHQGRAARVMLG